MSLWLKRLLLITLLLGALELIVFLYFVGTLTSSYGFEFNRTVWLGLFPYLAILLLFSFLALIRKQPFWLLGHVFLGPYYIFQQYGALSNVKRYWGELDWFAVTSQVNGWLVILYFTLAVFTLISWLLQRYYGRRGSF